MVCGVVGYLLVAGYGSTAKVALGFLAYGVFSAVPSAVRTGDVESLTFSLLMVIGLGSLLVGDAGKWRIRIATTFIVLLQVLTALTLIGMLVGFDEGRPRERGAGGVKATVCALSVRNSAQSLAA